ncbi:MAG TPA: cyanophycinase, partial [Blastocatellia bacterium]|nr:cyanophycinase [Blastocatellia bacterium]
SGNGEQSHRLGDIIKLAPGFGFIQGVIIDQHFAERGRVGRLLGVVAQNPKNIGVGIDENTAILVEREKFYVLGDGAVYVLDCRDVSESNIADEDLSKTLTVYDVKMHLLSQSHSFDLIERRPKPMPKEKIEELFPSTQAKDTRHSDKVK